MKYTIQSYIKKHDEITFFNKFWSYISTVFSFTWILLQTNKVIIKKFEFILLIMASAFDEIQFLLEKKRPKSFTFFVPKLARILFFCFYIKILYNFHNSLNSIYSAIVKFGIMEITSVLTIFLEKSLGYEKHFLKVLTSEKSFKCAINYNSLASK